MVNEIAISNLTVHPKHQTRGAGSLFIKWGMEQADRLGAEVLPMAAEYGTRVLEYQADTHVVRC